MLTEAQVARARTFPGCSDITSENAIDKLFAAAETLQANAGSGQQGDQSIKLTAMEAELTRIKAMVPKQTPPEVLRAMAGASRTYAEVAVSKQAVSPVVAEMLLARLVGSDDAPSAVGLTPSASGECVASAVFKVLAGNTPMPLVGREPEGQAAPRTTPGAPDDAKAPTADRIAHLLQMTPLGQVAMNPPSSNGNGHK